MRMFARLAVTALFLASGVALVSEGAVAQAPKCGPQDGIEAMLQGEKYREEMVAVGMAGEAYPMKLYVNPQTRSWTMLIVPQPGMACVVAAGDSFDYAKGHKPTSERKEDRLVARPVAAEGWGGLTSNDYEVALPPMFGTATCEPIIQDRAGIVAQRCCTALGASRMCMTVPVKAREVRT